jgi:hypothetical protein
MPTEQELNDLFVKVVDNLLKEDYGITPGSEIIELKARLRDHIIEVYVVGKWRGIRRYDIPGRLPSVRIMADVERSIRSNTGKIYKPCDVFKFNWE